MQLANSNINHEKGLFKGSMMPRGLFAHPQSHDLECSRAWGHNNKKMLWATSLLSIIFATVGMLVIQASTWLSLL